MIETVINNNIEMECIFLTDISMQINQSQEDLFDTRKHSNKCWSEYKCDLLQGWCKIHKCARSEQNRAGAEFKTIKLKRVELKSIQEYTPQTCRIERGSN